jgi:hypothetical protein
MSNPVAVTDFYETHRLGLSDKARYNFDSDMRRWSSWRGIDDSLTVADSYEIRDFVLHCATIGFERSPLKPASIANLLSSLASLHVRVLEAPDPTKDVIVKGEIKRLRRKLGNVQNQTVALRAIHDVPLPASSPAYQLRIAVPSIARLRDSCDIATPRGLRDRVLLGFGEDLGRRSRDLHLFNVEDIIRHPDGRGTALIRRSKTDQLGAGTTKIVSARTMKDVAAWTFWRAENAPDADNALLVSINKTGRLGNRLSPWGINYALRCVVIDAIHASHPEASAEYAWAIAREVSSHGFRVGLTQDGVAANADAPELCDRGGWDDERRPLAYARNIEPQHGAIAKLRALIPLR